MSDTPVTLKLTSIGKATGVVLSGEILKKLQASKGDYLFAEPAPLRSRL